MKERKGGLEERRRLKKGGMQGERIHHAKRKEKRKKMTNEIREDSMEERETET